MKNKIVLVLAMLFGGLCQVQFLQTMEAERFNDTVSNLLTERPKEPVVIKPKTFLNTAREWINRLVKGTPKKPMTDEDEPSLGTRSKGAPSETAGQSVPGVADNSLDTLPKRAAILKASNRTGFRFFRKPISEDKQKLTDSQKKLLENLIGKLKDDQNYKLINEDMKGLTKDELKLIERIFNTAKERAAHNKKMIEQEKLNSARWDLLERLKNDQETRLTFAEPVKVTKAGTDSTIPSVVPKKPEVITDGPSLGKGVSAKILGKGDHTFLDALFLKDGTMVSRMIQGEPKNITDPFLIKIRNEMQKQLKKYQDPSSSLTTEQEKQKIRSLEILNTELVSLAKLEKTNPPNKVEIAKAKAGIKKLISQMNKPTFDTAEKSVEKPVSAEPVGEDESVPPSPKPVDSPKTIKEELEEMQVEELRMLRRKLISFKFILNNDNPNDVSIKTIDETLTIIADIFNERSVASKGAGRSSVSSVVENPSLFQRSMTRLKSSFLSSAKTENQLASDKGSQKNLPGNVVNPVVKPVDADANVKSVDADAKTEEAKVKAAALEKQAARLEAAKISDARVRALMEIIMSRISSPEAEAAQEARDAQETRDAQEKADKYKGLVKKKKAIQELPSKQTFVKSEEKLKKLKEIAAAAAAKVARLKAIKLAVDKEEAAAAAIKLAVDKEEAEASVRAAKIAEKVEIAAQKAAARVAEKEAKEAKKKQGQQNT